MNKIHMVSVIDRDEVKGKTKTLCGRHLSDRSSLADNPEGESKVTCANCTKIIDNHRKEELNATNTID